MTQQTAPVHPRLDSGWWVRLASLVPLVGGWLFYAVGNDLEATAITDAGGDAGLWAVGIIIVTMAVGPGLLTLIASLVWPSAKSVNSVLGIVSGSFTVLVAGWTLMSFYPPSKFDDEAGRLDPDQWQVFANAYLACGVLLAVAGLMALLGGYLTMRGARAPIQPAPTQIVPAQERPAPDPATRR